jgi:hypothetical protein
LASGGFGSVANLSQFIVFERSYDFPLAPNFTFFNGIIFLEAIFWNLSY